MQVSKNSYMRTNDLKAWQNASSKDCNTLPYLVEIPKAQANTYI